MITNIFSWSKNTTNISIWICWNDINFWFIWRRKTIRTTHYKRKTNKTRRTIKFIFEFSKLTSGDKTIELEEINLNRILEECIIHYYEDYKKLDREIILDSKISKIKILSNKEMLTRVFDNLIGNSYKHSNSNLNIKSEEKENIEIIFSK